MQTILLPENYSYSSIFSFLLPPCSYFFSLVTCFLFLFFPRLATPFSLLLASSSNFLSLFYITLPFLLPLFCFLFFPFLIICISLLVYFFTVSVLSAEFLPFRFIFSHTFGFSAFYSIPVLFHHPHTHTHTVPRTDFNFYIKVFPILTTLFAE